MRKIERAAQSHVVSAQLLRRRQLHGNLGNIQTNMTCTRSARRGFPCVCTGDNSSYPAADNPCLQAHTATLQSPQHTIHATPQPSTRSENFSKCSNDEPLTAISFILRCGGSLLGSQGPRPRATLQPIIEPTQTQPLYTCCRARRVRKGEMPPFFLLGWASRPTHCLL